MILTTSVNRNSKKQWKLQVLRLQNELQNHIIRGVQHERQLDCNNYINCVFSRVISMTPYQVAILSCFYKDSLVKKIVDAYDPTKKYSLFDLFILAEEVKEKI